MTGQPRQDPPRVMVVGSGWAFTSGISYYTCSLSNALARRVPTDVILMRRLIPRLLYPGRKRVGVRLNDFDYDPAVAVLDGVDWYWGSTMARAIRFIRTRKPDVVVLQWWTGAVLHSYLLLARAARKAGAKVVIEWHEVQDTGEARIPGVTRYVRMAMSLLLRNADAHVVHSSFDLQALRSSYGLRSEQVTRIAHGPYGHLSRPRGPGAPPQENRKIQPGNDFTILFFGVIRPYKGLEDLVEAFGRLPEEASRTLRLRIVGETWEGWDAPLRAVARSPRRDRIEVINRYVSDKEVAEHFASADAVVLPYHRSSSSGPLHMAMSAGLPVVVTSVGGLVEAAGDYQGARFVPPHDPDAIARALCDLPALAGRRYPDPHSWDASVEAYLGIVDALLPTRGGTTRPALLEPGQSLDRVSA